MKIEGFEKYSTFGEPFVYWCSFHLIINCEMVESKIANFRVLLPKFERQQVNGKEIVFFQLQICSGRKKWKLNKRYSDFSDLDA